MALACALGLSASAQTVQPPLGVYLGGGAAGVARIPQFTQWFGRTPDRGLDFLAYDSWASLETSAFWACLPWRGTGAVSAMPSMTFSFPLTVQGTSLADVAAGLHDSSFLAATTAMVAYGWGGSVVRIGWEFNGSWMPWAAGRDPVNYVLAYRHVVSLMRSVPGANFTFEWCVAWGPAETAPDTVYPGNDVVDLIGMDIYSRYYNPADADPVHRWNTDLYSVFGLNWLTTYAQAHGKRISIPEWGTGEWLFFDGGTGGGDDVLFVTNMTLFLKANNAAYSNYWDYTDPVYDSRVSNGEHPLSGAALKAGFGPVTTAPVVGGVSSVIPPTAALPGAIPWIGVGDSPTGSSLSINFIAPVDGGPVFAYVLQERVSGTTAWIDYAPAMAIGWQTLSGLAPLTSYDLRVYATNVGGNGPPSPSLTLSTLAASAVPLASIAPPVSGPPGQVPWLGVGDVPTNQSISINYVGPHDGTVAVSFTVQIRLTGTLLWQTFDVVTWTGWQTIAGLLPGTSYDVQVFATNTYGNGPPSAILTLSTLGTGNPEAGVVTAGTILPGAIPSISLNGATASSLSVGFGVPTSGGTVDAYFVFYRLTGQTAWIGYGSAVAVASVQTLSGLKAGTSYDVEIYAGNGIGNGPASPLLTASTLASAVVTPVPSVLPGRIPALSVGDVATATSLSLNFAAPLDGVPATAYVVQVRPSGQILWTTFETVTWVGWQTVTGLQPGTSYDLQVYATNAGGSGLASPAFSLVTLGTAVTPTPTLAPTALPSPTPTPSPTPSPSPTPTPVPVLPVPGPIPSIGAGDLSTRTTVSFSFSAPYAGGAVGHYLIEDRVSGQASWTPVATVTWIGWQTITGLLPATSYDVRVTAVNATGSGAPSGVYTVSTLAPPGQVPALAAGGAATTTSLSISFAAPYSGGTPTGYVIQDRVSGQTAWTVVATVTGIGWQTVSGLLPGTAYDLQVTAVNAQGSGPVSLPVTLSTASSAGVSLVPGAIPWLGGGAAPTRTTVGISFSAPYAGGSPTAYTIAYRVSGQTPWTIASTVTWIGWQTVSGLLPGTSYQVEVYASNSAGPGPASAPYTVSTLP